MCFLPRIGDVAIFPMSTWTLSQEITRIDDVDNMYSSQEETEPELGPWPGRAAKWGRAAMVGVPARGGWPFGPAFPWIASFCYVLLLFCPTFKYFTKIRGISEII